MARIPDHVISEVRERADIVAIVGRQVTLKKSGPRHWGLCPFHNEKTPSFQVHEDLRIFHCFGCSAGGDVFSFRQRLDGLDFPDAVRAIAGEVGVEVQEESAAAGSGTQLLYRANEAARDYFVSVLRGAEGSQARAYLEKRSVSAEQIQRFHIGAAPDRWDGFLSRISASRIEPEAAEGAGLVSTRRDGDGRYDRFRNRIQFPIAEPSGRVVGFGGRDLGDGEPKYLNTAETPIYRKGRTLFGLPQALEAVRRTGRVVVVEGYFDVLALHRVGIEETVAPCGTALTADHAGRLRRYAAEVVLLFDGDEAGRQAAERALPLLLAEGVRVRGAFLPAGDDPDTLLEREGVEALRSCVEDARPLLDHIIDREVASATDRPWGASEAALALASLLEAVADPIERERHLHGIATRLDLRREALEAALERARGRPSPRRETPKSPERHIEEGAKIDPVSRALLSAVASFSDLAEAIERLELGWLPPGDGRELVGRMLQAARERGDGAIAWLCSEEAETTLRPGLRGALRQIVMQSGPPDRAAALQSVRDCLVRLEDRAIERELRDLQSQIETAGDPGRRDLLLERVQATLERRRTLGPPVAQV